jgi:hypothetical protein
MKPPYILKVTYPIAIVMVKTHSLAVATRAPGSMFLAVCDKALRLVYNTIEEIEFYGGFEDTSNSSGGIGLFMDFPNLKNISTDVESLIPQPGNGPENFSLLKLLPLNLESLYLTDARGLMTQY